MCHSCCMVITSATYYAQLLLSCMLCLQTCVSCLTVNTAAVTVVAVLHSKHCWDASKHVCSTVVCFQCTQHLCMLMQLSTSDELEGKFARLEGDDVDAELSAMKKGLLGNGGSSKAKQSLPEGRSEGRSEGRPYK